MKDNIDKLAWYLVYTNLTQNEIAKKIGVVPQTLSEYKKEPYYDERYQAHLDDFRKEQWEDIARLPQRAIEQYEKLFDRMDEGTVQDSVILGALKEVMKLTGFSEEGTTNVNINLGETSTKVEDYIKNRNREE